MADSTLLLAGTFETAPIDDVLLAVGLSRLTVEIVFEGEPNASRHLVVKAGRVLSAAAPPAVGREAFHRLYRAPGGAFSVWRRPHLAGIPIGSLAELIAESQKLDAAADPLRTAILAGAFADYRLDDILDVLAITRQLVELTTQRRDGSCTRMVLKSDRLLACEDDRGLVSGREAFYRIFSEPGETFEVVRLGSSVAMPAPLGQMPELLERARLRPSPGAHGASAQHQVVLEGTFARTTIADVLAALSLSRVPLELVMHRSRAVHGAILVKGGRVISARALAAGLSGREAFFELMRDPGETYLVSRRSRHLDRMGVPPCGLLRELLVAARPRSRTYTPVLGTQPEQSPRAAPLPTAQPGPPSRPGPAPPGLATAPLAPQEPSATPEPVPPAEREVVLAGWFADFSPEQLLSVSSLSRQCVRIETYRHTVPVAAIVVKAGQLLFASCGSQADPVLALAQFLRDPGTDFRARRVAYRYERAVGPLGEVLAAARRTMTATAPPPRIESATPPGLDASAARRSPSTGESPIAAAPGSGGPREGDPNASSAGPNAQWHEIGAALHRLETGLQVIAAAVLRDPPAVAKRPRDPLLWILVAGQLILSAVVGGALWFWALR